MAGRPEPFGVILAGGSGRRIGGSKGIVNLRGRPLIAYPLEALRGALGDVAIVAKADTELPSLPGVTVWIEPDSPRHPLLGLIEALGLADGRPVVVCPSDMPFVTAELIRALARADPGAAPAVVAGCEGRMQPLLGCYQPQTIELLRAIPIEGDVSLGEAIAGIGAAIYEVQEPDELFSVNAPDDLLQAAAMLDQAAHRAPSP
jgi:molybdopterin-guanine dinucleotide biosynthesis protein A